MLLSAYENDAWKTASLNWVEEKEDGAVEVIATKADGVTLALEHTLIQPFVGEKFDSEIFIRAFGRIDKNPALVIPERALGVYIRVHAVPTTGYSWDEVGEDLLRWLVVNHGNAPSEGERTYTVPVGSTSKNGPLQLAIALRTRSLPGMAGSCLIWRVNMPGDLGAIVDKALKTKIAKLVKMPADKRILLLECEQMALAESNVYREVVKLAPGYPCIGKIDEIWFADTSGLASEGWAAFELMDGRGLVEVLTFQHGVLQQRRDDRLHLGPPTREF
jgi:hypothetical protein